MEETRMTGRDKKGREDEGERDREERVVKKKER